MKISRRRVVRNTADWMKLYFPFVFLPFLRIDLKVTFVAFSVFNSGYALAFFEIFLGVPPMY